MESALRNFDKQMSGHQTAAISFNSSHFGKLVLLLVTQNNWSFRNINKIGFIMISVSVHSTFKCRSNESKLLFFIFAPPITK